jgi:hypothetical protein
MFRCIAFAIFGLGLLTSTALAKEESCLSGKNPRFNRTASASPSSAPSDAGLFKIMETARREYGKNATDAIFSQVGKGKPASNPAYKDQFGIPVSPITLLPGYVRGFQQVTSIFGSEGAMRAIIDVTMDDYAKRRILGLIVSRYGLADDLVTQYRLLAARGPVAPNVRNEYIERIGRLLNNNDLYLKQFFALDTINPNVKDGTVRAKNDLDVVDADLKDERFKKAALDAYRAIQNTDSYYKDLSLEELECRAKALSSDLGEAERIAKARSDAAAERRSREDLIRRTQEHDARRRANPSPRPQSTDVIPGSGRSGGLPSTGSAGPSGSSAGSSNAVGNTLQFEVIAPRYSPLQRQ